MKLGIMQPYFLPYVGYISLIKHTDRFILLDTVQFIRHGWVERNRILKPNEGWQYIQVPLNRYTRETLIKDTIINNKNDWKAKIIAQLQHYKKAAPFYNKVVGILNDVFVDKFTSIVDLNLAMLQRLCVYLEIERPIQIFSKMGLEIMPVNEPDEWALNISRAIPGVTEYWNPPGGMNFFDKSKYELHGVGLKFLNIKLTEYDQKRPTFEAGLSIIDVLMFNSIEQTNRMLDEYEVL